MTQFNYSRLHSVTLPATIRKQWTASVPASERGSIAPPALDGLLVVALLLISLLGG